MEFPQANLTSYPVRSYCDQQFTFPWEYNYRINKKVAIKKNA